MINYIPDTNALISFVTDRNPEQQEKVKKVFLLVSGLKGMIRCPRHVLSEFVYVMEKIYSLEKMRIRAMIKDFISMAGVEIVHETDLDLLLSLWPEQIPDFGDAVIAAAGSAFRNVEVLTFDRKFMKQLESVGISHVQV